MRMWRVLVRLLCIVVNAFHVSPAQPAVDVDWSTFLAASDPINSFRTSDEITIPDVWIEGSFAGNGLLGTQVLICPGGICRQSLLLGMNRSWPPAGSPYQVVLPLVRGDITDVRTGPLADAKYGDAQPRLGVGDLILRKTRGSIINGTIRTHLVNATITANIITSMGTINFSVFVHARRQLVIVTGLGAQGEDEDLVWDFYPAPAISPASGKMGPFFNPLPPEYRPNPPPVCSETGCAQRLLASPEGRGWATAWRRSSGKLLVALTTDLPRPGVVKRLMSASAEALAALDAADKLDAATLIAEHVAWWSRFYWSDQSGAFLSLPEEAASLEQFHWIQAYKVGSENACRRFLDSASPPGFLDNCVLNDGINGPLSLSKTKWRGAIWDMNVQGTQWASLGANFMEQSMALVKRIPEQLPNFIASVPSEMRDDSAALPIATASLSFLPPCAIMHCDFPLCNATAVPNLDCLISPGPTNRTTIYRNYFGGLPWICHSIFLVYRHTLDIEILQGMAPLLKRALNLYLRATTLGQDGKLHLPIMFSPEYAEAPDTSFDLALFRWCLKAMILIQTSLLPETYNATEVSLWQDTLHHLALPPVDPKTGSLMIGAGMPFASANKHFSHLFSIFPLGQLDWSNSGERQIWENTLEQFARFNNVCCVKREGFTFLGMSFAAIHAMPSLPGGAPPVWADYALRNVTHYFFRLPQLGASTIYADATRCGLVAGCRNEFAGACNESPLMASTVLQHMLLQSWNQKAIAVFPSIPASWTDARFARLRAEGAVLVSALRANATTIWIHLNATKGGTVTVRSSIVDLVGDGSVTPRRAINAAPGTFILEGGIAPWTVLLFSSARGPPSIAELTLKPLAAGVHNIWGSRRAKVPMSSTVYI